MLIWVRLVVVGDGIVEEFEVVLLGGEFADVE